jgi:hypothetical protein
MAESRGNMSSEPTAGTEARAEPVLNGVRVRSSYAARLLTYLMVMGPGLIVMEADNDAGAVLTYAQAGGQYGLHLLWVLLILLPVTYFVQEMVVRLGIATGKGCRFRRCRSVIPRSCRAVFRHDVARFAGVLLTLVFDEKRAAGQSFMAGLGRVLRRLSPSRSMRWALWTSRSRMASA